MYRPAAISRMYPAPVCVPGRPTGSRRPCGNNQDCRCRWAASLPRLLQFRLGVLSLRTWSTCSPHDLLLGKDSRRFRRVLASHLGSWSIATVRDSVVPMPAAGLQDLPQARNAFRSTQRLPSFLVRPIQPPHCARSRIPQRGHRSDNSAYRAVCADFTAQATCLKLILPCPVLSPNALFCKGFDRLLAPSYKLKASSHDVRLMPAKYVRAYLHTPEAARYIDLSSHTPNEGVISDTPEFRLGWSQAAV